MRGWIYGFFMTWGMFLSIPCPVRIWDEKARGKMMVCLPLVGAVVGGLWALAAWLLGRIDCPAPVQALVLAAVPWLTTGFLHLDGYMDVCDAVLSRRDLATRQKILKDSHCGAFAVIALGLLFLAQWSVFFTAGTVAMILLAVGMPIIRLGGAGCAPLAAAVGYGLAAWYGFRQLDGMSGDISGFALTLGELVGAAVLTLVR
mgnify:CR=1 FL=1